MRRTLCFLLLLLFIFLSAHSEKIYKDIPSCLQITQHSVKTPLSSSSYQLCWYPDTCLEEINQQLRALVDDMIARNVHHVPEKAGNPQEKSYLEVGSSVFRTGDRWASFLITACTVDNRRQLSVDLDARAYDMLTGTPLTLHDVLAADEGWQLLAQEVRTQLNAYFPQLATDESRLTALCQQETLANTPFTLNTAFLTLHYRADALYEGKNTLMHVRIPYSALREYMTEEALIQTDNSDYRLVALTYDDGPARTHTLSILRALRAGSANATFFIVGDRIPYGPELVSFTHDAGFAVASHTYTHIYDYQVRGQVLAYRQKMEDAMTDLIGCKAAIMRAPGGLEQVYIDENVQLPLLHWSLVAREDSDEYIDPYREARRLANNAQDGDIILMHDLRAITAAFSQYIPAAFAEKNFLCVTIEELFAVRGIPLEPNTVYYSAPSAQ